MSVAKKALQSTIFVTVSTYLNLGIGFVTSVILARLLEPQHFGIVALATFFLSLFGRVQEFGLDYALVHKQEDLEKAYSTHFLLQIGLALLTTLLVFVSSPILLKFYPFEVILVLWVLTLTVIFKAASTTQRVALEKELLFKTTTIIDILALLISSLSAIIAAFMGLGVWSLVINLVANTLVTLVGLWLVRPWKFSFIYDKQMIKWFFKFGVFLWIGGVTTFILFQYNNFIIGTFLGVVTLGYYTRAYNFATLPTSLVTSVISRVALPTYSKLQSDREKLSQAFSLVLKNIVRVSVPFSLILFITARDFIVFLIGEKWLPMVPIFQLLIIFSLIRPIFDDTGAFLTAIGKPQLISKYLTAQALLLLVLSPVFVSSFKVNGAPLALNLVMVFGVIFAYWYTNREIKISFKNIFMPEIVSAIVSLVIFLIATRLINFSSFMILVRLITQGALLGTVYFLVLWSIEGKKIKEEFDFLKTIVRS